MERALGRARESMMSEKAKILEFVRAALASEARVDLHHHPIALDFDEGTLTMEGEVASVAAKKLALECTAPLPEVTGIIDRLHVTPAQRMSDGQIRDLVRDALLQEPALAEVTIREEVKGELLTVREPPERSRGEIRIMVADGIVTLSGEIPSLAHKRLAGVLAWWVPGSRDVINGLGVIPPEEDRDLEVTDAVRMVLEKDPFVEASQLRVTTRNAVVLLEGLVPTESERDMAECDAWYVFGVDKVQNEVEVRAFPATGQFG
jgi:osmotically-inducible protein OsmY